ncbi:MAG: hypothetical protein RR658_01460 [Anaerorhabdus sp.]|uniref:hypothetical protein n=1 Tax=Anaerorhabdus sp. TaxID=1872524 RepID=UPI002FC7B9BF
MHSKVSKKGSVLLFVIMIFCLMTILGLGLTVLTNHNTKMTKIEMDSEQAYQSALSGLETTMDSFVKDPATGESILTDINSNASASAELNLNQMGKINIDLTCAERKTTSAGTETCKKIKVVSKGTYNGLSKTVEGILDVIDTNMEKPVIVSAEKEFKKTEDSKYCEFSSDPNVPSTKCIENDQVKEDDDYATFEKSAQGINKIFGKLKAETKKNPCKFDGTENKSCVFDDKGTNSGNLVMDNTEKNVVVYLSKVDSLEGINIFLKDPESEYGLIILNDSKNLEISNCNIGTSPKDSDNILLFSKGSIKGISIENKTTLYGWVVDSTAEVTVNGEAGNETNIYGGIYAESVKQNEKTNIYGYQPNASIFKVLQDAGYELTEGGSITFAKSYD